MRHRIHWTLLAMLLLVVVACPRGQNTTDAALDTPALDIESAVDATVEEPGDAVPDLERSEEIAETAPPDAASLADARTDDTADALDATLGDGGTESDIGLCIPGRMEACRCTDGRMGARSCSLLGMPEACECRGVIDAGWTVEAVAARTLPPRLIAPQSTMRVTSQRPTLRWVAPADTARVRVELCNDRACTLALVSTEVGGSSWRPAAALRPGVVFWRVRALGGDGGVTWTSATWEFFVGRRDTSVDSSYGVPRDFDGDGYDEVTIFDNSRLHFRYGAPGFHSTRGATVDTTQSSGVALLGSTFTVGDFNGDGMSDLATHSELPQNVSAIYGRVGLINSDALVSNINEGDNDMRINDGGSCDYDGDGYADLIGLSRIGLRPGSPYGAWIVTYPGSLAGIQHRPQWISGHRGDLPSVSTARVRCVGDINSDGYADALLTGWDFYSSNGFSVLYWGTPEGMNNPPFTEVQLPLGTHGPLYDPTGSAGDVNGDGFSDLQLVGGVRVGIARGGITVNPLDPETFVDFSGVAMPDSGVGYMPNLWGRFFDVGDFNGDGRSDIVQALQCGPSSTSGVCGSPIFWEIFGSSDLRRLGVNAIHRLPSRTGANCARGDFDGDGFGDITWQGDEVATQLYLGSSTGLSLTAIAVTPL